MARCWIDINLDAITENYRAVSQLIQGSGKCMAVVKADGYGIGAGEMALALEKEGCEAFAVTTVAEGTTLRNYGVKGMILVLGPTLEEEWEECLERGMAVTLSSLNGIDALRRLCEQRGQRIKVHIKLETGMGRTGFSFEQLSELAEGLSTPELEIEGIYTHFARAGQRDKGYTEKQFKAFQAGVEFLEEKGICPRYKHVCNSAAFLDYPQYHLDFVRIGTLLIGHYPGGGFSTKLALKDPWSAWAKVVHVRKVPTGTFVGYQSIYQTKKETQLAVIPVGYADGFGVEPRLIPQGGIDLIKIVIKNIAALFGKTLGQEKIKVNGQVVRIAGKIGMQLTVLDVGLNECHVGDEVELSLRRTQANPRLCRRYWQEGRICSERKMNEESIPSFKITEEKLMI